MRIWALLLYLEIAAEWRGPKFLFFWWCTIKSSLLPPTTPRLHKLVLPIHSLVGRGWAHRDNRHTGSDLPAAWQAAGRCFKCVFSINGADISQLNPLTPTRKDGLAASPCISGMWSLGKLWHLKLSACSQPLLLPPFFCTQTPSAIKLPGFPSSHLLPSIYCP